MSKIITTAVRIVAAMAIAVLFTAQLGGVAHARDASRAAAAQMQMSKAKAAQMKMMQARKAQAAQAGMAAAVVTAAALAAADAGECSPYLAKWLMTRSLAWKVAYDACMDD